MTNTLDNLMKLMCFTSAMREGIVDVIKTSDGFYVAMDKGDIGFNRFIGKPSKPHKGPGLAPMRYYKAEQKYYEDNYPAERCDKKVAIGICNILSSYFGVKPPDKIQFRRNISGWDGGSYNFYSEIIVVHPHQDKTIDVRTVLHEFAHHVDNCLMNNWGHSCTFWNTVESVYDIYNRCVRI